MEGHRRKSMFKSRRAENVELLPSHTKVANWAWSAELLLFALQPNRRLQQELATAKAALGWDYLPRPILAMHVRQGKQVYETAFFETHRFMQARRTPFSRSV
jgi:hypothetical protein